MWRQGLRESIWGVPSLIRNKPEGWRVEVAKTLGLWAAMIAMVVLLYATGHSFDWSALPFVGE